MGSSGPILAIDTSTDQVGVALFGTDVAISLTWSAGRRQTVSVLDQVDRTLALAGLRPNGVGAIAVANGPGMFTSLRVGLSLAKGLAHSLDLPVVAVSTLEVAAQPWLVTGQDVVALVSVGRGRVVWQRFAPNGSAMAMPRNSSLEELEATLLEGGPALVTGELPATFAVGLAQAGDHLKVATGQHRDPLLLAKLGADRIARQGPDDLVLLQPAYVHARSDVIAGA